jgi:hypothetical protein
MRKTSANYQPFPVVRDVDCLISFGVMDINAKKETTVIRTNDSGVFSYIRASVNDIHKASGCWAALEENLWRLDGSFEFLPSNYASEEIGWWSSEMSGADCTFENNPVVRFTFPALLSTLGWTLYFDTLSGQYVKKVRVSAYNASGVMVDTGIYTNDSAVFAVQHYVGDYAAVEFEFMETSEPMRRVRLIEVDFGITKNYDRNALGSVSMIYGADILSRSLPTRELVFTFDNSDKQYNLLNPDGVYQYLQEGQKIRAKFTVGGEEVDMGEFIFTSADVSKSGIVPEITAHDALYVLDKSVFSGGTGAEMTLSEAVSAVLGDYRIERIYDTSLASVKVTLSPPSQNKETSVRECIRMLAQAAMCTVYIDRDGALRFTQLSTASSEDGAITADELYDYSGVSISEPVDGVKLAVSSEYNLDADGKPITTTYTAGSVAVGSVVQSFSNPCVAPSNGSAVAAWLLGGLKMRKSYNVKNRCDPAVEIGDTVRIDDIFANRENAVITGIDVTYDGTLSAKTKGVGA